MMILYFKYIYIYSLILFFFWEENAAGKHCEKAEEANDPGLQESLLGTSYSENDTKI